MFIRIQNQPIRNKEMEDCKMFGRHLPARVFGPIENDLLSLQREMNRMFRDVFHNADEDTTITQSMWSPSVDITETESEYTVNLELPGVKKEDVKVTLENNVISIRGEKKQEKETKDTNLHRVERVYGSFERSFTLPRTVRNDKIDASYQDGVLKIVIPKAEEAKPKAIEVKVK
jgi:HSP20 family protein